MRCEHAWTLEQEDTLDLNGAADEAMLDAEQRELEAIDMLPKEKVAAPANVRGAALMASFSIRHPMEQEPRSWFHQAVLFDYLQCLDGSCTSTENMVPTVIAIARLVRKQDTSMPEIHCGLGPKELGLHLASVLGQVGFSAAPCSPASVSMAEVAAFKKLNYRVNIPTVYTWLSSYLCRFAVHGIYVNSLNHVWDQSISFAQVLVMRQAATEVRPRILSAGLLLLGFVGATLVSWQDLHSQAHGSAEEWNMLYQHSQPSGAVPTCALNAVQRQYVLQCLKATLCIDMQQMCEAVQTVSETMHQAMAEIRGLREVSVI